jgi:LysR family transcriptional regulator, hydrogen peroxide-inducible genes activator
MEMHQLRYTVAVARAGNFSRAAEQCRVAQPSLSQQIQKLEDELGERLFDRLKTGVKLTPAGEIFLQRAARILEEAENARREMRDAHSLARGTLNIGVLPTIAPYFLPPIIARFSTEFPGIEVVVHEDTTARLLKLANACEIDLAVLSLPITDPAFETQTLFTEDLLVAIPHGHPFATKRTLRAADLESERFILMKEGHCLGDQVLSFCNRREINPRVSCRSAQIETVQALVEAGLGISLIPAMACHEGRDATPVYRRLDRPRPTRTIAAVWPKQRPPNRAATEFLRCLKQRRVSPRS